MPPTPRQIQIARLLNRESRGEEVICAHEFSDVDVESGNSGRLHRHTRCLCVLCGTWVAQPADEDS